MFQRVPAGSKVRSQVIQARLESPPGRGPPGLGANLSEFALQPAQLSRVRLKEQRRLPCPLRLGRCVPA